MAGISHDTIAKVKKIEEKATEEQKNKLEGGEFSVNQVYKEIQRQEKREKRIERIIEISKGNEELKTDKKYPVVYADPPWRYEHCYDSADAIENHYPTMALQEICELPISEITTGDCILFLWSPAPKVAEAMSDTVYNALKELSKDNEYVFTNSMTGEPYNDIKRAFTRACDDAGIEKLRIHDLRHTAATRMVSAGIDLVVVASILGHSDIRITASRYAHPLPETDFLK